jgi:hypothetical protein
MKEKPVEVLCFPNGNIAVFDKNEHQMPELQGSWFLDLVEKFHKLGIDPTTVKWHMPDGSEAKVIKISEEFGGGWNWSIEKFGIALNQRRPGE